MSGSLARRNASTTGPSSTWSAAVRASSVFGTYLMPIEYSFLLTEMQRYALLLCVASD
jgi:hypothetical protein